MAEQLVTVVGDQLGPLLNGWHSYDAGPNMVCPAGKCTADMMKSQSPGFIIPGQDPSEPVASGQIRWVHDPWTGKVPAGLARVEVGPDGLSFTNTTERNEHVLDDGQVYRRFFQGPDGAWYATTHGWGNNRIPWMNILNQGAGPVIFNELDQQMRDNINEMLQKKGKQQPGTDDPSQP